MTTHENSGDTTANGLQSDAKAVNTKTERILYAKHERIFSKRASGTFRKIKWLVLALALGVYYILPWLRWDRGPSLPDQAFLLDFAHQRLYMFGVGILAQEMYYITGILIISALGLFMVTAMFGRIWCGYACPQTVWTDLMIAVEHLWQGDRNARIRLSRQPWNLEKIWKIAGTHLSWLLIALATGGAFVFYFRDAPTLAHEFLTNSAPMTAYIFVGIFTLSTYVLGGIAREQVCIYMCPWPRIQGAMFDSESLLVTYRAFRGEPRGKHKRGQSWEGRGDCIDCNQCIAVCPVGIDIRHGPQLECIQCSLCIDACDQIMKQVGRPTKLVAYDSYRNLEAESHGDRVPLRFIRPRTLLYAAMLSIVVGVMAVAFAYKTVLDVNVYADRDPLFVLLSDGSIRNGYHLHILNKTYQTHPFSIRIEGIPGAKLSVVGHENEATPAVDVTPDKMADVRLFVSVPPTTAFEKGQAKLAFIVRDLTDSTETRRATSFRGPEQ